MIDQKPVLIESV